MGIEVKSDLDQMFIHWCRMESKQRLCVDRLARNILAPETVNKVHKVNEKERHFNKGIVATKVCGYADKD